MAYIFMAKSIYMNQKKKFQNGSAGLSVFMMLFVLILFGCTKNDPIPRNENLVEIRSQSKFAQLPIIEMIESVNKDDVLVSQFKFSEEHDYGKYSYDNAVYQKVKFKNLGNLEGLLITLSHTNQLNSKSEIFFVRDKINNSYLSIMREKNTIFIKDTLRLKLKNLNGSILFNDQYLNGKLIKSANLSLSKNDIINSFSSSIKGSEIVWSCTKEQFTEFYAQAKMRCESDLFCDIACSFHPCFIAYVAFAVGRCTETIKAVN
jgi:hypothetical protein